MFYRIYQTDDSRWVFRSWEEAMVNGFDQDGYALVYEGQSDEDVSLDQLFEKFNIDYPDGYEGRSMSVSDVVVMGDRADDPYGDVTAHYVDSFGFAELDHDFWEEFD